MPGQDALLWAESGAASGLTARTALTDTRYQTSGDNAIVRSGLGQPYIAAMWGATVTAGKFEGFEIRASDQENIYNFSNRIQEANMMDCIIGSKLDEDALITGYLDNANTAEITIGASIISYGDPYPFIPFPAKPIRHAMRLDSTTDTGASLAWIDGAFSWTGLKRNENYEIVGIGGAGVLDVCGRLVPATDPATYKPGFKLGYPLGYNVPFTYFKNPFPFKGASPPAIEIASLGASAEHHLTVLLA